MKKAAVFALTQFFLIGILVPGAPLPSYAASLYANAVPVESTPFDRKLRMTGVLETGFMPSMPTQDLYSIFSQARSFRYTKDRGPDRWQSPEETQARHAGDCEDKAVWLFAQLKQSGYSNVRLVVGKYREFEKRLHVWVAYTDELDTTYILDPAIQKRVWIAGGFSSGFYKPIYSYDGQSRYRHTTPLE